MIFKRLLFVVSASISFAAIAQKKDFNYNELLQNKLPQNFITPVPVVVRWVDDDKVIVRRRVHPDSTERNVTLDLKTATYTELQRARTVSGSGSTSSTTGKSIVSRSNDLYYINDGTEVRLTSNKEEEKNPTFSPDSNYIAYTRSNNLFTYNLKTLKETQLTTDGTNTTLNGYASWVYWEEIFGRGTRYRAFWWSPDSKKLAYMRFDESMIAMFPIYVSEGQHGYVEETRYPKAGDKNPEVKVGIVNPDGGQTVWADFNEKDDQYFGWPIWNPTTNALLISWINRDQNDLKIYDVNTSTGSKKLIYNEKQKTWVDLEDGAGGRITWLEKNKGFILISDKTGWNHLYLHNSDGTLKNAITSGNFTVLDTKFIDEKNGIVYFTARGRENTARTDLYSIKMNGSGLKRLTFGDYHHSSISMSPNGKNFVTTYSNATTPTKMALVDNTGKVIRELANLQGSEMNNYNVAKTELIRIKSADGLYELPALVTWPVNMDRNKKYPILVSIYGGPNAGNVWDTWTWNANRQFMANEGLIQVAFDHRASGHFGKQGVNYMHRNLGYWEMEDYKTMAKWFIANGNADPSKVCITGFSYGGYMSAYALTYGADVFTHGMAGGSVVDWGLYDSHYTEKFMGTPQNNAAGYKSSSVFTHIDKYKGMLQIVHGTSDDNVHMQNSMQLISALQDKKKDFEFMLYPGGRHGWGGAKGEHFTNLKTKFIYEHLLQRPVPKGLLK